MTVSTFWEVLSNISKVPSRSESKGTIPAIIFQTVQGYPIKAALVLTLLTSIIFAVIVVVTRPDLNIIDVPINFTSKRIELTKDYIKEHYGLEVDSISIEPKMIVLHWMDDENLTEAFDIFNQETVPADWGVVSAKGGVNVSTHFIVTRDGKVLRLMPETRMARHVIGLNYNAIGIENIRGKEHEKLTQKQLEANVRLVKYLMNKYKKIEYLIGHYEYTRFENHPLWMEKDKAYRTVKTDPNPEFVASVYANIHDLRLKRAP